jgi:hypothetical protein
LAVRARVGVAWAPTGARTITVVAVIASVAVEVAAVVASGMYVWALRLRVAVDVAALVASFLGERCRGKRQGCGRGCGARL